MILTVIIINCVHFTDTNWSKMSETCQQYIFHKVFINSYNKVKVIKKYEAVQF